MSVSKGPGSSALPGATLAAFIVTAAGTTLALICPGITRALQRAPAAVDNGEWWRLITPILVNPEGWHQIALNLSGLLIVGAIAERSWDSRWWFAFYIAGGLVGEIAGLAWRSVGAGSSVAVSGLVGALSVSLVCVGTNAARLGATIILAGAVVLSFLHDLHGPPILAAACLAACAALASPSSLRRRSATRAAETQRSSGTLEAEGR